MLQRNNFENNNHAEEHHSWSLQEKTTAMGTIESFPLLNSSMVTSISSLLINSSMVTSISSLPNK